MAIGNPLPSTMIFENGRQRASKTLSRRKTAKAAVASKVHSIRRCPFRRELARGHRCAAQNAPRLEASSTANPRYKSVMPRFALASEWKKISSVLLLGLNRTIMTHQPAAARGASGANWAEARRGRLTTCCRTLCRPVSAAGLAFLRPRLAMSRNRPFLDPKLVHRRRRQHGRRQGVGRRWWHLPDRSQASAVTAIGAAMPLTRTRPFPFRPHVNRAAASADVRKRAWATWKPASARNASGAAWTVLCPAVASAPPGCYAQFSGGGRFCRPAMRTRRAKRWHVEYKPEEVRVDRIDMRESGVCFTASDPPPMPDQLPLYLSTSVSAWLKQNLMLTVRATLPIVANGNTIAVYVWFE